MNTCHKYAFNNINFMPQNFKSAGNFEARKNSENNNLSANFVPQELIDKIIDNIQAETSKEYNKTAIAAGSGVLLLGILVAALNPRVSAKFAEKLKILKTETAAKLEKNKGDFLSSKFYKLYSKALNFMSRAVSFTFNGNSIKDTYFKKLCTEKKNFGNVKNKKLKNVLENTDNIFLKIFKKPHEWITKIAGKLAVYSVKIKYKKIIKRMNNLELLIKEYSKKLPEEKRTLLNTKLEELQNLKNAFSESAVDKRLLHQEEIMKNLNNDVRKAFYDYRHGFSKKMGDNVKYINDNLIFWAEDILKPQREVLNKEGKEAVNKIAGGSEFKGIYNEITEVLKGSLTEGEEALLRKKIVTTGKKLRNANINECENYFDKKRDLTLGSAPTDIVSAIFGITAGSLFIAKTKDKDAKITRLLTGILPTIGGMFTGFAMTAMLISGPKGMLIGAAAGGALSLIGSGLNKLRLNLKGNTINDNKNTEVSNV